MTFLDSKNNFSLDGYIKKDNSSYKKPSIFMILCIQQKWSKNDQLHAF